MGGLCAWSIGGDNAGRIYPHILDGQEYQVFGAEFAFTFLLVALYITYLTLANKGDGYPNTTVGIAVGWMVLSAIDAIGKFATSSCVICLNPGLKSFTSIINVDLFIFYLLFYI